MKTHNAAAVLAALMLVAGCEDKTPAPAAKSPPATPAKSAPGPVTKSPMPMLPAPQRAANTPGEVRVANLIFKVPDGWKQVPPANQMRVAELQVPDPSGDAAKTCVAAFSVAGGDPKANIGRWAGQVTDAEGKPATPRVSERTVEGIKVTIVDLAGAYTNTMGNEPRRENWAMRAAILEGMPDPAMHGQALFIKMTGPAERMAAAAPAFDAMIDGLKKQ